MRRLPDVLAMAIIGLVGALSGAFVAVRISCWMLPCGRTIESGTASTWKQRAPTTPHLFLAKAKEHVIREPIPIPSLETIFEVTVNGRVHKVPGSKLQKWILKR